MTDTLSTEVIGYRQWHITPDLTLRAAHKRDQVWTVGTNTAACKPHDMPKVTDDGAIEYHTPEPCVECPSSDHECGIYALHDPSDFWYGKDSIRMSLSAIWAGGHDDPIVSGVIAAWGNMEVHHSGFRTQHARVVALALPGTKRDAAVARAVANAYGVPLVPVDELPRIAAEFGSTVPVEMRPPKPEESTAFGYSKGGMTFTLSTSAYGRMMHNLIGGSHHMGGYAMPKVRSPKYRLSYDFGYDALGRKASDLLWAPEETEQTKAIDVAKPDVTSFRRPTYDPLDFLPKRKGGRA